MDLHEPARVPRVALDDWRRLLREQHGVISTGQAERYGLTMDAIVANVDARRWRRLLRGVYSTSTGEPTRPARLMAALLYAGDPVVLSHRTAAEEWGIAPIEEPAPVHVTVPYGCAAVSAPGVVVHRSRAFRHIVVATDPPRTSLADTVIDLAAAEPTWRLARRRLVALVTGSRVSPHDVALRLQDRPPRRFRTALADGLRLVVDGVQSALEERYASEVEEQHGIPGARRQTPVVVDGRTLYEDCTYDELGTALTVRLDGRAFHTSSATAFRDRRRDNAAELAGRSRLVYGWRDVAGDPCAVAAEVVTVLRRLGWPGGLNQCEACG